MAPTKNRILRGTSIVSALALTLGSTTISKASLLVPSLISEVKSISLPASRAIFNIKSQKLEEDIFKIVTGGSQIVFIDKSVKDYKTLVNGLAAGAEVYFIDKNSDGVKEMANVLSHYSNVQEVHIIAHGEEARVQLGSISLDAYTLSNSYKSEMKIIKKAMAGDADMLVHSCNTGHGKAGREFVEELALVTGADIAASDDMTGNAELGGDWDLEIKSGEIDAKRPFSKVSMKEFTELLAVPADNTAFTFASGWTGQNTTTLTNAYFTTKGLETATYLALKTGAGQAYMTGTGVSGQSGAFVVAADGTDIGSFQLSALSLYEYATSDWTSIGVIGYKLGGGTVTSTSDIIGNGNTGDKQTFTLNTAGTLGNFIGVNLTSFKVYFSPDSGDTARVGDCAFNGFTTTAHAAPSVDPTITSATYDASSGALVVTGTNFAATTGVTNDVIANKITLTGEGGETYTLTDTANVEISSSTSFTLTLSSTDKAALNKIINTNGTASTGGTTYDVDGAAGFIAASASISDTGVNGVTVSSVTDPTISSATYDYNSNILTVSGANFVKKIGATNDVDISTLTFTGEGGATYSITSATDVEITSGAAFSVTLSGADILGVESLLNKNGTTADDTTTVYNVAAADNWMAGATLVNNIADATGNAITVSNYAVPTVTSATYDYSTGALVVTGTNFVSKSGATNDVDISKLIFTGEGGATYTLTSATDVEVTSATSYTVTLSGADLTNVEGLLNKDGTTSATSTTTFSLASLEDWMAGSPAANAVADTAATITVSNYAAPVITSATYNYSANQLVVTGTNFISQSGTINDIDLSTLTLTGEGSATYTITTTTDIDVDSATQFTVTFSGSDLVSVEALLNKNGTTADDTTTAYNVAAADNWMFQAPAATDISDATSNAITVSNYAVPTITSATYNFSTGSMVFTGTNLVPTSGATNDIVANKFTFTGDSGATYTLTDSANVEISSESAFTLTLSATDKLAIGGLLNKDGTTSDSSTTYNINAQEDWIAGTPTASNVVDATSNAITVSNYATPTITSATYDYNTNILVVTGTNFVNEVGATNDVDISTLTFTGEAGTTYTITSATDVEVTSATSFSVTLSGSDIYNVEALLNKNSTSSNDSTVYNLAGADNWMSGAAATTDIADTTATISVSNYALPSITSATYDVSNGQLAITGTNLVNKTGATNDINASLLTLTGEGGTYTLTNSANVELTSATAATLTLSSTDQLNVHGVLNKNGTTSSSVTVYNLAGAEDWLNGSPTASNVADLTSNSVTVSNVATPTITSATYDSDTGVTVVTGTNLFKKVWGTNDVDISTLTFTGGTGDATYTVTSATDVEITSATSFSLTLSGSDKTNVDALLDQIGTTSTGSSTYNLASADNWLAGADSASNIADATNAITVSINPKITSATYNASTGVLVVTGTNIQANGGGSDIDASMFTLTGEGSETYALTDTTDVNRDSVTQFTLTLSATDKAALNQIINKDGTSSTNATTYNIAAADNWNTNVTAGDTSDTISNAVTASSVATPTVTSSTYDVNTGVITVTGTNFTKFNGTTNDINVSKFTFTGEGGSTYALTNTTGVEITNGTTFTITLNATDKDAVNLIVNKDGTSSTSTTTYNISGAEDWINGADSTINVVDATNAITASNVPVPTVTSATYSSYTSTLTVTGTALTKADGANNDVNITKLTVKGQGGASYTLTNTTGVELTSSTQFAVLLTGADTNGVNALINKDGTSAIDTTVYNLAAAEDWINGADAATTTTVDATSNGVSATINDTPQINTTFVNFTINEDSGISNYEINISDGEGSDLNLTVESNDTTLMTVDQNWTNMINQASWNGKTLDFNLTTVANANGVAKITVTVNDTNKTSSKDFNVTVSPVNDAPTITAISNLTKAMNFTDFNLSFNGVVDVDQEDLNISFETNDSSIVTIAKTWDNNVSYANYFGKDFNLSFASVTGKIGTAEVNISINDGTTITREEFNITVADTTPDAFGFTALTAQALSTSVSSSAVTITGMGDSIAISITGGEYQIDGGAWTSSAGTMNNSSSVKVRVTTSSAYSTASSATLTIGTLGATFSATTTTAPVATSTPTYTYTPPATTTVVEPTVEPEPVVVTEPVVVQDPVVTIPTTPQEPIPEPVKNITITIIVPDTTGNNDGNVVEDKKIIINELKTGTTIGEVKESKTDIAGVTTTSIVLKDDNGNEGRTLDFTSEIDKKDIIVTTTEDGISMNSKLNKEDGSTESINTKVYTNGTSQTVCSQTDKDGNIKSVIIQSLVSDTVTNTAKDGVVTTQRIKDNVMVKASTTKDGLSEHKVEFTDSSGKKAETKATSNVNNSAVTILENGSIQTNATTKTEDEKILTIVVEGKVDGKSAHLLQITDKNGNSVVTKATSDIKGAQTVVSKSGSIVTSAMFKEEGKEDTQLSVEANVDGSATHRVIQHGLVTKVTSLIAGAKTSMSENGKVTTEAKSLKNIIVNAEEYSVKGIVVTLPNGESYTEFEKTNIKTGEKLEIERTVSETTPFEAGNDTTLTEEDGNLKLEIETKVTRDIIF